MKTITVFIGHLSIEAILIREYNPRLAICQDRICQLDKDDSIIYSIDLLDMEWQNDAQALPQTEIDEMNQDEYENYNGHKLI